LPSTPSPLVGRESQAIIRPRQPADSLTILGGLSPVPPLSTIVPLPSRKAPTSRDHSREYKGVPQILPQLGDNLPFFRWWRLERCMEANEACRAPLKNTASQTFSPSCFFRTLTPEACWCWKPCWSPSPIPLLLHL